MAVVDLTKRKSIAILISFLLTFAASRLIVFLIEIDVKLPFISYNIVNGYHIHHFTYGIAVLSIVGFVALFIPDRLHKTWLFMLYGFGLGLVFDEFGIWLKLNPYYNDILSTIAVFIITILLLISAFVEHRYHTHYEPPETL